MKDENRNFAFVSEGRWCKHNVCQLPALLSAYPDLGTRELALLDYIISWSEREKVLGNDNIGLPLPYEDVLCIFNLPAKNKNTAKRILKKLCDKGLISKVNEKNRKGRSAFIYLPNVSKIRKAIFTHLERNEIDKEP